jgi:fatty acid desaturase
VTLDRGPGGIGHGRAGGARDIRQWSLIPRVRSQVTYDGAVTAGDLLTLPELRDLREKSSRRGAGLVLHAWASIAAAMLLYALWPSALTLIVAVVVIGGRQHGLAVLMHEASHWLLFPGQPANNRVGTWLCAAPIWRDLPAYRRRHHLHHRHARQPQDPDLALSAACPMGRRSFWRAVGQDLGGWTAASRMLAWRPVDGWRPLRRPLTANALLLGVLAAAGQWHLYPLLWLLPLATWYRLATRIRDITEHALVTDDDDPLRNARTTAAGVLERAFLAPYWVNHHLEHHLLVFVPCWRLRDAHALLLAKGHGPRMELARGYLGVLRRATALVNAA